MDPSWHATDSDDWEHVLPPDSLPSSRSSLSANHTSGRYTPSELEKEISFFDFMYDDTQMLSPRYPPVVSPADITDSFGDVVPKSRTAALLDARFGPRTNHEGRVFQSPQHLFNQLSYHQQRSEEALTTFDAGSKRPTSPDTAHHHNPDFLASSTPIHSDRRNIFKSRSVSIITGHPQYDELYPDLLFQPDSRPISQEQLAAEVKSIYAGLAMVENKCIHVDRTQAAAVQDLNTKISRDHWQAMTALHRTLLHEHHDFFLTSQHPSASPALRGLAKYQAAAVTDMEENSKNTGTAELYAAIRKHIKTYADLTKECSDHVIPGLLDSQHTVDATGDTGAKYNFLNEGFAKRCKFKIDSTLRRPITIASGQKVMTTGIAEVSFCFRGEQTPYPLKFHVLPGCVKNVILGKSFLKATKTFSNALNFAKRVMKRFARTLSTHEVLFLGASPPMFAGLLNGETKTALADSASKVLLMNEDYARSLGLSIVSTEKTRIKLRFADGSTAFTSGKTYNVSWQFGTGKRYPLNFYILKNAPADVILSEDFLLRETKAFIKYADCLIEDEEDVDIGYYDDSDDDDYFFAIDRDENYHPRAYTEGANEYFEDDYEDARRTEEDLLIASLHGADKDAAIARAKARRDQWAAKQAASSLVQGGQNNTTNTASSPAAHQSQANNTAGVPSASRRQRWLYKLVKKRKFGKAGQNP